MGKKIIIKDKIHYEEVLNNQQFKEHIKLVARNLNISEEIAEVIIVHYLKDNLRRMLYRKYKGKFINKIVLYTTFILKLKRKFIPKKEKLCLNHHRVNQTEVQKKKETTYN